MKEAQKIIIADDEKRITELVADFLSSAGYEPITAADGEEALAAFRENSDAAAVILDVMMPEYNGWEVCGEIRKVSAVPIILLSARAEEFDQLMGFESGADEYVTKPFSPAVLVKRVEALIRRNLQVDEQKREELIIEKESYKVRLGDNALSLALKEFELLCYLYDNKGRVLSRDQILDAVWSFDFEGDARTVDSHIARLRVKLGEFGGAHIKTVYGIGYKFEV